MNNCLNYQVFGFDGILAAGHKIWDHEPGDAEVSSALQEVHHCNPAARCIVAYLSPCS